jgi:WD40 repeat protein
MNCTISFLTTAAVVLLATSTRAGEPPAVDVHGDALPAGAVARAGTIRLRPASGSNVAWSRDGKRIAAGSGSDVRLWDAATGKVAQVLPGKPDARESVTAIAFSPDGRTLAAAVGLPLIRLWDLPTRKAVREIDAGDPPVRSISFSPDGKTLMAVLAMYEDGQPRFWDVVTGAEVKKQLGGSGQSFVGMAPGWEAALWAEPRGTSVSLPPTGPDASPRRITFDTVAGLSPDGEVLAVGRDGGFTVQLNEVPSGLVLRILTAPPVLPGPNEPNLCGPISTKPTAIVFSSDRRLLAVPTLSNMTARTIDVWDVGGRKLLCRVDQSRFPARNFAFSPDGRALATIGFDEAVHLFDTATGKATAEFEGEGTNVSALAFSPDGKKLLTGTRSSIRVWDAATGRHERVLTRDVQWVYSLAFSPDGKRLASGGGSPSGNRNDSTRVWDAATGNMLRNVANSNDGRRVGWSADGKTLAVAGEGVRLWNEANREPLQLAPATSLCYSVAFSADGRLLAFDGPDNPLQVWDLRAGKATRTISLPKDVFAPCLAISCDGSLLAAGGTGGAVRVWRTGGQGDEPLFQMRGKREPDWINSLAFSPDGRFLASAGDDDVLHLWDVATGALVTTVPGAFGPVAFSPDGTRLATSGGDSTAVIWDFPRLVAAPKRNN